MRDPNVVAFSLDALAGAAQRAPAMDTDPDGNLIIAGRTRWRPVSFAPGLRAVLCARVDQPPDRRPT